MHSEAFAPAGQSERLSRMRSQMQGGAGSAVPHDPSLPRAVAPSEPPETPDGGRDHPRRRRWPVVVLAIALVLALAGGVYTVLLARAWEERASELDVLARDLGEELAETRGDLEETQGTLALVERQLDGAQEQIHELADSLARTGDDREVQRQVLEYQTELFTAAAGVTGTMSQCISDQNDYVTALEEEYVRVRDLAAEDSEDDEDSEDETPAVSPADLAALRQAWMDTCQEAADAHADLRNRLGDS